jgi:hypothetical protein
MRLPKIKLTARMLRVTTGIAIATMAFGVWATFQNADVRQSVALATSRRPNPFTQLYFVDPVHLPRYTAGQPNQFAYRITNNQPDTSTYTAHVTLTQDNKTTLLRTDTMTIGPGNSADITVNFTPQSNAKPYTVTVALPARQQQIRFQVQP